MSDAEFRRNWRVFTLDQLEGLDWRGLVAAGGAVLACATTHVPASRPTAEEIKVTKQHLCRAPLGGAVDAALIAPPAFLAFHGRDAPGGLATADIDLWLVGDFTPEAAAAKVEHIDAVLRANAAKRGATVMVARTKHTLTFFGAYPFRCVQVVCAVFPSAAALLLEFDLDCCALGFDGVRVLAPPRAVAAVTQRTNIMRSDIEPRGHALGRAHKYATRGFGLVLPRSLPAPLSAARADDIFSAAKLAALYRAGAPVTAASLFRWRTRCGGAYYPRQPAQEPPQLWVAGVCAANGRQCHGMLDPRAQIFVAGIIPEDQAVFAAEVERDIIAQCGLVEQLYPAPGRCILAPAPDFPHVLPCATNYDEPAIAYGPPPENDNGRGKLQDLNQPPQRAPVTTEETAEMITKRQPHGVHLGDLMSLLQFSESQQCEFSPASFADARPVALRARVAVETAALPPLLLAGAQMAPTTLSGSAFGATWLLSAAIEVHDISSPAG